MVRRFRRLSTASACCARPAAIASSASRRSARPACIELVRLGRLRGGRRERLRLRAELLRHGGDVAQHIGRDVAQRLHLVGEERMRLAGVARRRFERLAQRADLAGQRRSRCWRAASAVLPSTACSSWFVPSSRADHLLQLGAHPVVGAGHRLHDGARLRAERAEQAAHVAVERGGRIPRPAARSPRRRCGPGLRAARPAARAAGRGRREARGR